MTLYLEKFVHTERGKYIMSVLLGFGLDAYVVVGTNSEGSHAWVLTRPPV